MNALDSDVVHEVRICPDCSSSAVDFSTLAGGAASCKGCGWAGHVEDLISMPFIHNMGVDEQVFMRQLADMRQVVGGENGLPFLKFLGKWGFVTFDQEDIKGTINLRELSRYLAAISRGVLVAVAEERLKIEQERVKAAKEKN